VICVGVTQSTGTESATTYCKFMALVPGTLPTGTCYGTPQDLLELFAQYLDIPAFAVSSKVLYSATSPYPNTDFVWVDTAGGTLPVLKLYNETVNSYEEYPFQGQLSPGASETLISNKSAISSLSASDHFLVSKAGSYSVLKKIAFSDLVAAIVPSAGSITYPMLSTSTTESVNVAKRMAKAWVMFNGTGTPAIANSFNVSSITDGGVGLFTINLTVVASQNDCVVCNASDRNPTVNIVDFSEAYMTTGGNVFFSCFDQSAFKDPTNAFAVVFGV
jgi:hypothetical protein